MPDVSESGGNVTEHIVGTEHEGPDVRATCSCGWRSWWTTDAPDTVRDQQAEHLLNPGDDIEDDAS